MSAKELGKSLRELKEKAANAEKFLKWSQDNSERANEEVRKNIERGEQIFQLFKIIEQQNGFIERNYPEFVVLPSGEKSATKEVMDDLKSTIEALKEKCRRYDSRL